MRVQLELPELTEFPNGFPAHWMNVFFTKNRPDTYQIHAITTTYLRLVEAAMEDSPSSIVCSRGLDSPRPLVHSNRSQQYGIRLF
jgi:hypothetical protein